MNSTQFPPVTSASTPLVSPLQAELVQQIDSGKSFEEIYVTVTKMAEELRDQDWVPGVDKSIDAFTRDRSNMSLLLHSIPRPVLRSIVMRTVAHDFHDRGSTNRKFLYDKEGPGAYIVTLSIRDRRGCTWNAAENVEVVSLLRQYALAIKLCEKFGPGGNYRGSSQLTEDEMVALETARNVDQAYSKPADQLVVDENAGSLIVPSDDAESSVAFDDDDDDDDYIGTNVDDNDSVIAPHGVDDTIEDDEDDEATEVSDSTDRGAASVEDEAATPGPTFEMPRYATGGKDRSIQVARLASMLENRHLHDFDPDEPCKQSVSMVGNAGDIEKRTQDHRLTNSLRNSAKTWGVLIYCLKHAGLDAEETIIPVCKAWKPEQINLAETLVTVLAGSLISVGGLNVKQPGTRGEKNLPDVYTFENCRRQVWRANPWFEENLAASFPNTVKILQLERGLARGPDARKNMPDDIREAAKERSDILAAANRIVRELDDAVAPALRALRSSREEE